MKYCKTIKGYYHEVRFSCWYFFQLAIFGSVKSFGQKNQGKKPNIIYFFVLIPFVIA